MINRTAGPLNLPLCQMARKCINSLVPERFELHFRNVIFKLILAIDGYGLSCEIALWWIPLDLTDKSTLVQVKAARQQAITWAQWPSSKSSFGIIRSQWVKQTWVWKAVECRFVPLRCKSKYCDLLKGNPSHSHDDVVILKCVPH